MMRERLPSTPPPHLAYYLETPAITLYRLDINRRSGLEITRLPQEEELGHPSVLLVNPDHIKVSAR